MEEASGKIFISLVKIRHTRKVFIKCFKVFITCTILILVSK